MNYPGKKIINDISNYRFILKTIKKNKETIEWNKLNLRSDWIGRIYTVINLPPEVIHSSDAPEEIRPAYILEESRPVNEYLTGLNLQEILLPEITPIENSISYLIIYKPYFRKLTLKWFIYRIILITSVIILQKNFDIINLSKELIKRIY